MGGGRRGGNTGCQKSLLYQYGTDLTDLAKKGKIYPVIGRDKEIARVIENLKRRTKNNTVHIGEAGGGKTAVVEGLDQQLVDGSIPDTLQDNNHISFIRVYIVQGNGLRGPFATKLHQSL
ncbi:Clp protease ClpE, partial [Lactobacillus taiwanensis]